MMRHIMPIIVGIIAIALFISTTIPSSNLLSNYCKGWEVGYVAGYCFEIYGCNAPNTPNCPTSEAGFDTYQDGYNRGFSKGKEDKE
jgi:hypothetical protein